MTGRPFISILVTAPGNGATDDVVSEVPLDVCRSRRYRYGATITDQPIESGASVSDHRRIMPDAIEIEGTVSGMPLSSVSVTPMQLRGDSGGPTPPTAPSPLITARSALLAIHRKSTLVTIVDEYDTYENMLLESLEIPRDAKTGLALDFTATFKQVKLVSLNSAALPASVVKKLKQKKRPKVNVDEKQRKALDQARQKVSAGKASAEEASKPVGDLAKGSSARVPKG